VSFRQHFTLTFSHNSSRLLSVSDDRTLHVWNVLTEGILPVDSDVDEAIFSSGSTINCLLHNQTFLSWNITSKFLFIFLTGFDTGKNGRFVSHKNRNTNQNMN
jgi:WD40 repeat protein